MHRLFSFTLFGFTLLTSAALGAAKPHVIGFGKWTTIKWCVGPNEGKCLDLKVRTLYGDGRSRESTLGASHHITERLLVVRRAFRVNDTLPAMRRPGPGGCGSVEDGCWWTD
jgi:hypothetical protein